LMALEKRIERLEQSRRPSLDNYIAKLKVGEVEIAKHMGGAYGKAFEACCVRRGPKPDQPCKSKVWTLALNMTLRSVIEERAWTNATREGREA